MLDQTNTNTSATVNKAYEAAGEAEIPTVTAALAAEKAKAEAAASGEMNSGAADPSGAEKNISENNVSENNISEDNASESNTSENDIPDKYKDLPVDEDGIRQFVTKDMLIGDILEIYPQTAQVLLSVGMHCISCGVALYESLEEASYVHGLDPDDVAKVVNDALTTQLIEHPGEEVKI